MKLHLLIFISIHLWISSGQAVFANQPSQYRIDVDVELTEGVHWKKLIYEDIFDSKQVVNILEVDLKKSKVIPIDTLGCERVSRMAKNQEALAAINGTFFNEECDSRNYLKIDGSTLSKNIIRKKGGPALLINNKNKASLKMIGAKEDPSSAFHGIGGFPLLVQDGKVKIQPQESTEFYSERHPRTAVGIIGDNKVVLITLDGRSFSGQGFTMEEWALFLKDLGLSQAMNLDGGGSTTMWIEGEGVVNNPSDFTGERPVTDGLAVF